MSAFGTIIQIGDVLVSEDVVMERFCCDYEACRGRCCIEGDDGAPVEESELEDLERGYETFGTLMSEGGHEAVKADGFFTVDRDCDLVTPLVRGTNECAYCCLSEDGGCLCAIEKCGLRKPMSCKLYPIRITKLTGGGLALNVHHWDICKPAFEKGEREGVRVYQFLKGPLVERFGEEFYEALEAAAQHILGTSSDEGQ